MFPNNGNGFTDWVKAHLKEGIIGLILVGFGFSGGFVMEAIDNQVDANTADIGTLDTWQAEFYGEEGEWQLHLDTFNILSGDFYSHLEAYTEYTELNDQDIIDINADIEVIDNWMTKFYNDDEDTLGEWQELMAEWTDFYNEDRDFSGAYLGEFQSVIEQILNRLSLIEAHPPFIIYITE